MRRSWVPVLALACVWLRGPVSVSSSVCKRTAVEPGLAAPAAPTKAELAELAWFPTQFDWCEQGYCTPTRELDADADTEICASCFLHAALASAQDRIKIQHKAPGNATQDWMLNRQSFLNCGPAMALSAGCEGGKAEDVFKFMQLYGLPEEKCLPYTATDHNKLVATYGSCPPEAYCANASKDRKAKAIPRYRAEEQGSLSGEYAIIKELLRGPVACGIASTEALEKTYKTGVFEDKTGASDVTQDVEIVGWGEENGVKFWNVRNSMGPQWGDHGFFKIVRGKNNLGIEADCHYMVPEFAKDNLVFEETAVSAGGSLWRMVGVGQDPLISKPQEKVAAPDAKSDENDPVVSDPAAAQPVIVTGTGEGSSPSLLDQMTGTRTVVIVVVVVAVVGGAFVGVRAYRKYQAQGYMPLV